MDIVIDCTEIIKSIIIKPYTISFKCEKFTFNFTSSILHTSILIGFYCMLRRLTRPSI